MIRSAKRAHGMIRRSQLVNTFGPGALVDLPHHSVIVGGLETWDTDRTPIFEERLEAVVSRLLDAEGIKLFSPPIEKNDPAAPPTGIAAFEFPSWFVAQHEDRRRGYRARPLVHRSALTNQKYETGDRKKVSVVPVRFVQACVNGHIADIDWYGFVHQYQGDCRQPLWIEEHAPSGDLADIFIRCECEKSRSMAQATRSAQETLGFCRGLRPWLGVDSREKCGGEEGPAQPNRLLIRSASDAYFPQVLSVISIPDVDASLKAAVDRVWEDFLAVAESVDDVRREKRKPRVASALSGLSDEQVWAEVERRRSGSTAPPKTIKQAEIETLLAAEESLGEDAPAGADFFARRMPAREVARLPKVERVVKLHRLREVVALVGFTRFEPATTDVDGELSLDVRRASLARDLTWLPAYENRGEGFFLSFQKSAIDEWLGRPSVQKRARQLDEGIKVWMKRRANPPARSKLPRAPYVLLHSLSHLLITAVSLECGYSASAIRERIYAGESGYGILLYTGTPDSEGTLGGLVQVVDRLAQHVATALELGRLCSNDPVCAQHQPDNVQEERFLHGAACHGCLLIAEPSCERRNEFLDRALVVSTVEDLGCEMFPESD